MSQSSATADTTKGELVSPEGTQEGKDTGHLAAIKLQSLPVVSPKNSGCEEKNKTGKWPQIAEVLLLLRISSNFYYELYIF